jgi:hypothetical protein
VAYYSGQGDYYRGVGDPGIFDFLGRAIKSVGRALIPVATAGTLGPIGILATSAANRRLFRAAGEVAPIPGAELATRVQSDLAARVGGGRGRMPKGMKIPKHLGGFGHRKRMNVANIKALRRSVRRLLGFYHLSHQVMKSLGVLAKKHHLRAPAAHQLVGTARRQHLLPPPRRGDFFMAPE